MKVWANKLALAGVLAVALFVGGMMPPTHAATKVTAVFTFAFTCANAVDYSYGQVCVHTNAGTALSITIHYCSGYNATSKSLKGTHYANNAGNASWWWKPQTKCRGSATATVKAVWHGMTFWRTDNFIVR